jgi:hypothetical protein
VSNKRFTHLNSLDQLLRRTYPAGPSAITPITITKVAGFELFNTRPYHNHENFSDGYEATDGRVWATAEDLEDCIHELCKLAKIPSEDLQPWQLLHSHKKVTQ